MHYLYSFFKVWDLSDHEGRGFLDKQGLFIACKLVALSQANRELLLESILDESPAPNFGDLTAPGAKVNNQFFGVLKTASLIRFKIQSTPIHFISFISCLTLGGLI